MKKQLSILLLSVVALTASACGNSDAANAVAETKVQSSVSANNDISPASIANVPIKMTINGQVFKAYLYDNTPSKSLFGMLPKTVTLNDSDNDFCGDTLNIAYSEKDVQSGYKNGDIAYWPPAKNFVIFVHGEETSANTDNLVILGHIDEPQSVLDSLHGKLTVEIGAIEGNEKK